VLPGFVLVPLEQFSDLAEGRSPLHLSVLEAIFFKTSNSLKLCPQRLLSFNFGELKVRDLTKCVFQTEFDQIDLLQKSAMTSFQLRHRYYVIKLT